MKLRAAVLSSLAALALATPAGIAAGKGSETKVVCINQKTFQREYKVTPKHCIFHKRHAPKAEAFFVRTKRDHWRIWGDHRAKGKGTAVVSMGPSTPVKIRLFHPVHRCGHRVFAKAHFRFPKFGSDSTVRIDTCA